MPGFEIFGDEERKQVEEVLETGVLFRYGFDQARRGRWKARTFETELARRLETGYCHLCSSGTAALSIALAACGVGAGDEVIVPPFTFVATFEAVLQAGAVPVFADIDETLCLAPESIEKVLTNRTRAVMPVHMCGAMARIDEIRTVCDRKGLVLIEDTCQALGATFKGQALGTFGHAGCFSFDSVKTITCGEGGGLVTNDRNIYRRADAYADHGHDHMGDDRGLEDHLILGSNFRISELNAAVGLAQLRKLDWILEKQRAHKKAFKDAMSGFAGITWRRLPDEAGDSATFLSFFLPDAAGAGRIAAKLKDAGVDSCFYWFDNNWHYLRHWGHLKKLISAARLPIQLMDNLPDYDRLELPVSDSIMGRLISMQIKLSWTAEEVGRRIENIGKVLKAEGL
ncbi:MAG: L-glutamine--2-deoxy-scyllo-inosose aminotransferase KanB [Deltaproteobacteria bacterium]|nr:MAG: L-glutamine--2-deoxy-scyllo-inosose aminotransferase KanB [Deltaproteobacteria bacterium]